VTEFPIVDEQSGEVLAADEPERLQVMDDLAGVVIECARAVERGQEAQRKLALLMDTTDAPRTIMGWTVACELGAAGQRSVNSEAIWMHAESLAPLGLGPVEVQTTTTKLPTVGQLTTKLARQELAKAGVPLAALIRPGAAPKPTLRIYKPSE
jgi:hypothetical protein